jgi:hypothetical protein
MLRRVFGCVLAIGVMASVHCGTATACDRVVTLVQPQFHGQVFGAPTVPLNAPVVVAPLTLTPLVAAPVAVVPVEAAPLAVQRVRVSSRTVNVKPSRARSVTRVRTFVR